MRIVYLTLGLITLLLASCGSHDEAATFAPQPPAPKEAQSEVRAPDLSTLPFPYNEASLDAGRMQFAKCRACHLITPETRHSVGPNLYGMFDRKAGTAESFRYSEALTSADLQWSPELVDQWLQDPKGFLPGNRMTFVGIKDADERRDLIAYLLIETGASGE